MTLLTARTAATAGLVLLAGLAVGLHPRPAPARAVRLPFSQHQRWGYFDAAGRVVIPPRFASVQPFREGLAAVRAKGRYGYIDSLGRYVLPPAYDYATPFDHGYALVWQDSTQLLIDRHGRVLFHHPYQRLTPILDGPEPPYVIVTTRHHNQGVVDLQGRVLVDTLYASIQLFREGRAVVNAESENVGVVDRQGRVIVPAGRYYHIEPFQEGLALVDLKVAGVTIEESGNGFIDRSGRLVLRLPARQLKADMNTTGFQGGVAAVTLLADTVNGRWFRMNVAEQDKTLTGLIDRRGRVLFRNGNLTRILPFAGRLTLAETQDNKWVVLDKTGRILPVGPFDHVFFEGNNEQQGAFPGGLAFVRTAQGVGVIDSSGRFVVPPRAFEPAWAIRKGNHLEYQTADPRQHGYLVGCWAPVAGTRLPTRFNQLHRPADPASPLLAVVLDGRPGYATPTGQLVWQQPAADTSARPNIDYQPYPAYRASSPEPGHMPPPGSRRPSPYDARPIGSRNFAPGALSLRVDTRTQATHPAGYRGYPLYLANTTGDTLLFDVQSGRLDIRLQARNRRGRWQDIEYLPPSHCGNSYHRVFLASGQLWQLVAPAYEGELKTQLRAVLRYQPNPRQRTITELYSNEFAGSVNPGQFWRRPDFMPTDPLDYYLD